MRLRLKSRRGNERNWKSSGIQWLGKLSMYNDRRYQTRQHAPAEVTSPLGKHNKRRRWLQEEEYPSHAHIAYGTLHRDFNDQKKKSFEKTRQGTTNIVKAGKGWGQNIIMETHYLLWARAAATPATKLPIATCLSTWQGGAPHPWTVDGQI